MGNQYNSSSMIRKKVRTTMLSKGEQTSQTNSANPGTLVRLAETYRALRDASAQPIPAQPSAPRKELPYIESKFQTMAAEIGVCPYELQAIMTAEFSSDQTMVFDMLKKFVALVKLSAAVDLTEVHTELKQSEIHHRRRVDGWQKQCEKIDAQIKKIYEDITQTETAFASAWGNILIDLITKLERNSNVNSLGDWDKWMVYAIANYGGRYASVKSDGTVSISFKDCKVLEPEKVANLPTNAAELQKEDQERKWNEQLAKMSSKDLMYELFKLGDENEDNEMYERRYKIESAIAHKIGRHPVYDRWGNLDWNATFYRSEFTNENGEKIYDYEVDDPDAMADYELAMRKAKYKAELKNKASKF